MFNMEDCSSDVPSMTPSAAPFSTDNPTSAPISNPSVTPTAAPKTPEPSAAPTAGLALSGMFAGVTGCENLEDACLNSDSCVTDDSNVALCLTDYPIPADGMNSELACDYVTCGMYYGGSLEHQALMHCYLNATGSLYSHCTSCMSLYEKCMLDADCVTAYESASTCASEAGISTPPADADEACVASACGFATGNTLYMSLGTCLFDELGYDGSNCGNPFMGILIGAIFGSMVVGCIFMAIIFKCFCNKGEKHDFEAENIDVQPSGNQFVR